MIIERLCRMAKVVEDLLLDTELLHDHIPDYDPRYVNITGDTMTGNLIMGTNFLILGLENSQGTIQAPAATTANASGSWLGFNAGAGLGTGRGGTFHLSAGSGGDNGAGGWFQISAGDSRGGDNDGGDVIFGTGEGTGAGRHGQFHFDHIQAGIVGILDFSLMDTSDKTFTFPNVTGTFALLEAANVFRVGQVIDGTDDEVQLIIQAHSTQTNNILEIQASDTSLLLTIDGTGNVDHQENAITNFDQIAMKGAVEATISAGEITITEGHIRVDTEADATNDDLDTINSTQSGEILFLLPADDARTVRIRHGMGNIFLKHQVESKSFSFASPSGSFGTFVAGGYYSWASNDANLTQASLSVTHSAANSASACHIGIVAGGAGTVDTGVVKLTVAGTTIDDDGVRQASQTVILVADITTLSLNQYVETTEKWIGQVTIALATASGSPVNFNVDINYGCSKYEDFGNQSFTVTVLECIGRAGANDTGFNLRLFHHSSADWTYATTGFVPGGTVLANMNSDYSTEQNLVNGESFAYKRVNLNTDISGDDSEGLILEVTTSANKAVEVMDIHFGVHTAPNFAYLATTKQHLIFMKHGSNWLEL